MWHTPGHRTHRPGRARHHQAMWLAERTQRPGPRRPCATRARRDGAVEGSHNAGALLALFAGVLKVGKCETRERLEGVNHEGNHHAHIAQPRISEALALANRQVRSPLYALPKPSRPFSLLLAKEPLTHQARLVALRWVERRADPRLLLELLHEIRVRRAPCLDLLLRLRRPEHRRRSPHWTCTTRNKAGVSGQRGACRPIGRGWPTLRAA